MVRTVIFDLSEVLIAGLFGIEKTLTELIDVPVNTILPAFKGDKLINLCCGKISEDDYLDQILHEQKWSLDASDIKKIIRQNFHHRIPGMEQILTDLSGKCHLILVSDHAEEWVDYINGIHPFLEIFEKKLFSYELKNVKRFPSTFRLVLNILDCKPQECLFIDDTSENVAAATEVGIPSILFTSALELNNKLLEFGV